MKKILAILFSLIIFSSVSSVYAEEPMILEQVSPSGQILVKLEWPEVYTDVMYTFKVSFHDPETGVLLDEIRLVYDVEVNQHDHHVESYKTQTTNGIGYFEVFFPEESQGPAEVLVHLRASVDHGFPTVYKEDVVFSVNVVPEFGIIAMIILSIAFIPILLLSKSKLMPKFY